MDDQEFTMSLLTRVEPFVLAAERRSFRAAAAHLGVTPTAVSKAVAALEAELGVRLLHRTSRRVALTPEGEVFLRHGREALDQLQAGRDLVTHAAQAVRGRLKVSLSVVLARPVLAALPRLTAAHPELRVQLACTDRTVNLAEEAVDVALRTGELPDAALVARRLRTPRWVLVAAPAYLDRAGTPHDPEALAEHACLQFSRPSGQVAGWRFAAPGGGETAPFVAPRGVLVDHGDLLVDGARAGLGLAQVFDFMVTGALRDGSLVEVLPGRSLPGPPIHALCQPGRQRVPRVRAFLELMTETFGAEGAGPPRPATDHRDGGGLLPR